jgi:hypothetical protein
VRFAKDNETSLSIMIDDIPKIVIEESLPIHEIVSIVNSFSPISKMLSFVRFARDAEGSPLNLLFSRFICTSCVRLPNVEGIYPVK